MNAPGLKEDMVKDYLYEEYFIKKYEEFLARKLKPEVRTVLGGILEEAKGHSVMLQGLMKSLRIDLDEQTASGTIWLLQSLLIKKGSSRDLQGFLNGVLAEEIDLRKLYETQVKRIDDGEVRRVLNRIIEEEHGHEAKVRELLGKA